MASKSKARGRNARRDKRFGPKRKVVKFNDQNQPTELSCGHCVNTKFVPNGFIGEGGLYLRCKECKER